jgi:hypothetical protein
MNSSIGKILILLGAVLIGLGVLFLLSDNIPWLGRLPGDIQLKGKKWTIYFPLATCIILSILLTLVLWLFSRFRGR